MEQLFIGIIVALTILVVNSTLMIMFLKMATPKGKEGV